MIFRVQWGQKSPKSGIMCLTKMYLGPCKGDSKFFLALNKVCGITYQIPAWVLWIILKDLKDKRHVPRVIREEDSSIFENLYIDMGGQ